MAFGQPDCAMCKGEGILRTAVTDPTQEIETICPCRETDKPFRFVGLPYVLPAMVDQRAVVRRVYDRARE